MRAVINDLVIAISKSGWDGMTFHESKVLDVPPMPKGFVEKSNIAYSGSKR